ncbi:MAG: PEP-CTERM sorting domain-containing protein [Planctomycetota bacterium]
MQNVLIACAGVAFAGSAVAQVQVFTDRAAWEAAVGDFSTEDFNDINPFVFADQQTLDTGLLQITRDGSANGADGVLEIEPGGNFGDLDGTNFISGETGASPHETVRISASSGLPVVAFGADWFSPFSGDGIALQAGDDVVLLDSITGFNQGFVGIIATSGSFSEIQIIGTADAVSFQELWSADNLSFAVIPAPASAALLGIGGLAASRRRR